MKTDLRPILCLLYQQTSSAQWFDHERIMPMGIAHDVKLSIKKS